MKNQLRNDELPAPRIAMLKDHFRHSCPCPVEGVMQFFRGLDWQFGSEQKGLISGVKEL